MEDLKLIIKGLKAELEELKAQNIEAKEGELTAKSTKKGFEWVCNAPQDLIIKHTEATIESAFETLSVGDRKMGKMLLAPSISRAIQKAIDNDNL